MKEPIEPLNFDYYKLPGLDSLSESGKLQWAMLFYTLMAILLISIINLFTIFDCCATVEKVFSVLRLLGCGLVIALSDRILNDTLEVVAHNYIEIIAVACAILGALDLARMLCQAVCNNYK